MTTDPDMHETFNLWFETLPSSDNERVLVWPHPGQVHIVLHWNEKFHSDRIFATQKAADAWAHELHTMLLQDTLAGALLEDSDEVITQFQEPGSLT